MSVMVDWFSSPMSFFWAEKSLWESEKWRDGCCCVLLLMMADDDRTGSCDREATPVLPTQRAVSASVHLANDRMLRLVTSRLIIVVAGDVVELGGE